jgi:hypothetical protein
MVSILFYARKEEKSMDEKTAKQLALGLASICVRNTSLENLHAGIVPASQIGDNSDVFVSTPNGNIPWNQASKITDAEMKQLMIEVVDKIYTVLLRQNDPEFVDKFKSYTARYTSQWDEPKQLQDWFSKKSI